MGRDWRIKVYSPKMIKKATKKSLTQNLAMASKQLTSNIGT